MNMTEANVDAATSALPPAASLSGVSPKRQRKAAAAAVKKGDLTALLAGAVPQEAPPEPAAPPEPIAVAEPAAVPEASVATLPLTIVRERMPDPVPAVAEASAPAVDRVVVPSMTRDAAPAAQPWTAAPPRQSAPPAAPAPERPVRRMRRRAEDILAYWEHLRAGRRSCPQADAVDRELVGQSWPDSLIVAFNRGSEQMPRISRLGEPTGAIEYTPMVTEWILSRGRQAINRRAPLDEIQRFPVDYDNPRFRLIALPLDSASGSTDCVLCHLCRAA